MTDGIPTDDPTGARGDDCTGAAEVVGCTMTDGIPTDDPTGAGGDDCTEAADEAGSGFGAEVGLTMIGGRPTDGATEEGLEDFDGTTEGSNSDLGEGLDCTMVEGRPLDGTTTADFEEGTSDFSLLGSCGRAVEAGAGLALELGKLPVDPRPETEGDDGGGMSSTGAEETGAGDAARLPVPDNGSLRSGTAVTTTSWMEVTVLVRAFASLLLTMMLDEVSGRGLKTGLRSDGRSNLRDSSCSDVLEDEDECVGAAGAVELVTIWRLTCRGK
jgi:hypothetical protein